MAARKKPRPPPDECPTPRPGTRMLEIPQDPGNPFKLAEEQVERLRREEAERTSKKAGKKKRRGARRDA